MEGSSTSLLVLLYIFLSTVFCTMSVPRNSKRERDSGLTKLGKRPTHRDFFLRFSQGASTQESFWKVLQRRSYLTEHMPNWFGYRILCFIHKKPFIIHRTHFLWIQFTLEQHGSWGCQTPHAVQNPHRTFDFSKTTNSLRLTGRLPDYINRRLAHILYVMCIMYSIVTTQ